jgi:hypothetical protein
MKPSYIVFFIVASVAGASILSGCASAGVGVGGDDLFLARNLDGEAKARALADRGSELYNELVARDAAYNRLDEVREYFVVALRYDPENAKAIQYVRKIDDFRGEYVRGKLKEARSLAAKPKRTADEDYKMVAAIQAAAFMDPENTEAAGLLKQNAKLRQSLFEACSSDYETACRKASAASGVQREQYLTDAYVSARRAAAVDPSDPSRARKADALAELVKLIEAHSSAAAKLEAKLAFEDAEKEVARIAFIDRKAEGAFVDSLTSSTYALYYSWAKSLESRERYPEAAAKADKAIAARRSADAVALRKRIDEKSAALRKKTEDKKAAAGMEASFDSALADVDRLIASGDVVGATERMDAAAGLTKDQSKLDKLDERRGKVRASLARIYADGVAAYRAEDFKSAIGFLQAVVSVDAEYEQAADFLSKAKEKQRLVEQYSK